MAEAESSDTAGLSNVGQPVQTGSAAPIASAQKQPPSQRFGIDDFAVQGADKLLQIEIEEAIYPF